MTITIVDQLESAWVNTSSPKKSAIYTILLLNKDSYSTIENKVLFFQDFLTIRPTPQTPLVYFLPFLLLFGYPGEA